MVGEMGRGGQTGSAVVCAMDASPPDFSRLLLLASILFVATALYFGTQGGFYDSDDYHGNGSAH
ncbi:MAG TPA: hypothetical protein DD643_02405 [Synechococcus sp. UBA8638]|nr:hypothetical protein [Synechococcus sp. UBA8638]